MLIYLSKRHRQNIDYNGEARKLELLDHVIRHNGTKSWWDAEQDLRTNQQMSNTPGGAHRMPPVPYVNI